MCYLGVGPLVAAWEEVAGRVPWFMLFWVVFSGWTVMGKMGIEPIVTSRGYVGFNPPMVPESAAWAITIAFLVLKLGWCGSLLFAWGLERRFRLPVARTKRIMQADEKTARAAIRGKRVDRVRFRTCGVCDSPVPLGDRVYHCRDKDRHYPVYEHYCFFLWLTVYLDTMKPYLLTIVYLCLDGLFCFGMGVYALAVMRGQSELILYGVQAVVGGSLATGCGWYVAGGFLKELGCRNTVMAENKPTEFWFVRTTRTRAIEFVKLVRTPGQSPWGPWDLGTMENLRQVFGQSVWTWPLFFIEPERVTAYYDPRPNREPDFPLGEMWKRYERGDPAAQRDEVFPVSIPLAFPSGSRRSLARSSGVSVEE